MAFATLSTSPIEHRTGEGSEMSENEHWYIGSMNDALFIIDKPPYPAPDDTGPWDSPTGPNPISAAIDEENAKLIVDAHNASIDRLRRPAAKIDALKRGTAR
jgi:hypothetical protein